MTPTATRRAIFTTMLMGLAIVVALLLSQAAHTAARSRPKHSVYVTRDLTAYANLTKRRSPCDWDAVARSVQTKPVNELTTYCEKALAKGRALFCMLRNSQLNPGYATRWTDSNALRQYGYELEVTRNYDVSQFAKEFAALGIPLTGWTLLDYSHTADGNVGGTTYPATGAFFHNAINERAGALIAEHNINPDGENALRVARGERPISPVPDLKQWSDITYLGLKLFSPSAPSSIRHVFHDNIINRETKVLFGYVIDQEHLDDTNEWPGFAININEFRAIAALASPKANGIAWFFGQHKTDIGIRYVDKMHIYACSGATDAANTRWCLYMHIADVPAS